MNVLVALMMLTAAETPLDGPDAPANRNCKPLADVLATMDIEVRPLPEEAVQPLLAFHNASPPVSEDFWTKAVYGTGPKGIGIVMWMRGDEVCDRDLIPPPVWVRLLPLIQGSAT